MNDMPPDFDRARWKDHRWSGWSFRNTAQFLPSVAVAPADRPRQLRIGLCSVPDGWRTFLAETHATSAILLRGGDVAAVNPQDALIDAQPHMLFSITKSIIGLITLVLIDRGVIRPDASVGFYLPDLRLSAFGEAQISELLAMTDGVSFNETYSDPDAEIHSYSRAYWGDAKGGVRARLQSLPQQPRVAAFAYRTPVADVIGAVLAAATGHGIARLVSELLWRPIGAAHSAHFILDTAGVEIAGAGFNAASSDLARLALMLLDGGAVDSHQVIPERLVSDLFAGGDRPSFAKGYAGRTGWSYRNLWWHMGGHRIAALGVHGQRMIIDREHKFALIRTGAQPEPDNSAFDAAHDALLAAISSD